MVPNYQFVLKSSHHIQACYRREKFGKIGSFTPQPNKVQFEEFQKAKSISTENTIIHRVENRIVE